MNIEEKENLKLQNAKKNQTTTSKIINFYDSDTEMAEKITQILIKCKI